MQIKNLVNAATNVAGRVDFFTNTALPAEQVLTKIVFPFSGVTPAGGATAENLPAIGQLRLDPALTGGAQPTKIVARLTGAANVDLASAAIATINIAIGSNVVAALQAGTNADPSVFVEGQVAQAELTNAQMALVRLNQAAASYDLQVRLTSSVNLGNTQITGQAALEVYVIGLPLQ